MVLRVTRQFGELLGAGAGKLRATRQFAEVLGAGEGELRVYRQYLEVLAQASTEVSDSASSTLAISDDVSVTGEFTRSASSIIGFNQALPATYEKSASNTISFAQLLAFGFGFDLESEIEFDHYTDYIHDVGDHTSLHDTLALVQSVEVNGLYNLVDTVLELTDEVEYRAPFYRTCWTRIIFESFLPFEDKFEKLESEIELTDTAGRDYEFDVADTLTLTDEGYRKQTPYNTLTLIQSLDWGKFSGIPPQPLNLIQILDVHGDWVRSIAEDLNVGHSLTYLLPDPCDDKAYTPFVGESTIATNPTPPSNDLPDEQGLPEGERFILMHPAIGESTDVVELRAPNLDNRDRQAFTRINRETRGGTLTVFSDPNWPTMHTLVLGFSGLTKTEVEETHSFLVAHLGKEVGIIDWEGRQWIGVITTPNERAVQDGKERFTLTFEFEGVLVENNPSGSAIALSDVLDFNCDRERDLEDQLNLTDEVSEVVV